MRSLARLPPEECVQETPISYLLSWLSIMRRSNATQRMERNAELPERYVAQATNYSLELSVVTTLPRPHLSEPPAIPGPKKHSPKKTQTQICELTAHFPKPDLFGLPSQIYQNNMMYFEIRQFKAGKIPRSVSSPPC